MVGLLMTTNSQAVSTEKLLTLVADPQRRLILTHLQENGEGAVRIEELTEPIAADGGDAQTRRGSDDTHAVVALQHTHLPALAEAGIIEYNHQEGTVRYHSNDRLEELLQFISTRLESGE